LYTNIHGSVLNLCSCIIALPNGFIYVVTEFLQIPPQNSVRSEHSGTSDASMLSNFGSISFISSIWLVHIPLYPLVFTGGIFALNIPISYGRKVSIVKSAYCSNGRIYSCSPRMTVSHISRVSSGGVPLNFQSRTI